MCIFQQFLDSIPVIFLSSPSRLCRNSKWPPKSVWYDILLDINVYAYFKFYLHSVFIYLTHISSYLLLTLFINSQCFAAKNISLCYLEFLQQFYVIWSTYICFVLFKVHTSVLCYLEFMNLFHVILSTYICFTLFRLYAIVAFNAWFCLAARFMSGISGNFGCPCNNIRMNISELSSQCVNSFRIMYPRYLSYQPCECVSIILVIELQYYLVVSWWAIYIIW